MSLLSRKGTWFCLVWRALITFPKADNDLLIAWASFNLSSVTPDLSTLEYDNKIPICYTPSRRNQSIDNE